MAQPAFRWAATPPNLANRGAEALVIVDDSRLLKTVPTLPYINLANGKRCLPCAMLEGIYLRVMRLDAAIGLQAFGMVSVAPNAFCRVEDALVAANMCFDETTFSGFLRRLHAVVAKLPASDELKLVAADLINNQAHSAGNSNNANRVWTDEYSLSDLVDGSQRLSVCADLALLTGNRTEANSRLLAPPQAPAPVNRWTSAHEQLVPAALAAAGLAPRVVANRAADPVPSVSAEDDEDALISIADFVRVHALPPELTILPTTAAETRALVRLMKQYALPAERQRVVEMKLDVILPHFDALNTVLQGATLADMGTHVQRLCLEFGASSSSLSLAALDAVNDELKTLVYVLGEGGGSKTHTPAQRVSAVIRAVTERKERAKAAPKQGTDSAGPSDAGGSHTAVAFDRHSTGAPCFTSPHARALETWLQNHQEKIVEKLNTKEQVSSDDDELEGTPLESGDFARIFRVVFAQRSTPLVQFCLSKSTSTAPPFAQIGPFRGQMLQYFSLCVAENHKGAVPTNLKGFMLADAFVTDFIGGKWVDLDFYNNIKGKMDLYRGEQNIKSWPGDVFAHKDLLIELRNSIDKLFGALGCKLRSRLGIYSALNELVEYYEEHSLANTLPGPRLYEIFRGIMTTAQGEYRMMMAAGPFFPFFSPTKKFDTWREQLENLKTGATALAAQRRLGLFSPSPSTDARAVSFEGRGRSPSPSPYATALAQAVVDKSVKSEPRPSTADGTGSYAKNVVTFDAAQIKVRFLRASDNTMVHHAWSMPKVTQFLRSNGMASKCAVCAVIHRPNRHMYCPVAGSPGHESKGSDAHNFGDKTPWKEFLKPEYKLPV